MPTVIRFLLDENVPNAIARGLKNRGVEVLTASEAGLLSADDEVIAEFALEEGHVVFSQDADFLRIDSKGTDHAGIVYAKQGTRSIGEIIHFLELMSQCLVPEDMSGQVEYF